MSDHLMKTCPLSLLVGNLLLLIALAPPASAQVLLIDLASQPISLSPDLAHQEVTLLVANPGSTDVRVNAATFKFQIGDGPEGVIAPRIMGVDLILGTPWSLAGAVQSTVTSHPEYHDVRVFANFFGGLYATLPPDSLTPLGTITFDTTGISGGTWSFRMADLSVDPVNTKYELLGGGTLFPIVTLGSVAVVPEIELAGTATALCLLASLGLRRWTHRTRSWRPAATQLR